MTPPLDFGPKIIPQIIFGFGATQDQTHYYFDSTQAHQNGFGPHIVSQRHYGFGNNQAKPHYGFGSYYSDVYRHIPPVDFNAEILETLMEADEIIPLKP